MDKQMIKEALSNKYKNLGFDDKAFEGVADFAQTYIKEEADLATFVNGAEGMLKGFQSSTDRLRTEKAQLEKEKNELAEKVKTLETTPVVPPVIPPEPKPAEETPAWAKVLIDSNTNLQKELDLIKQGESTKSILEQAKASFFTDELDPERKSFAEIAFRERTTNITPETKLEDVLTNIKTYYNELCSGDSGKGYIPKPASGGLDKGSDWTAEVARLKANGQIPKTD